MNQCLTILVVLLATGALVHCQDDTVSTTEEPTTTGKPTPEPSDTLNDQPDVFSQLLQQQQRKLDQKLQQLDQQLDQQLLGQESMASDLLSTLTGFLPSFPSLSAGSQFLPCLGLSSMSSGRCVTSETCEMTGGSEDKGCLRSEDVCCIPSSKCGSVIRSVDTWVSSDEYPNGTRDGQSCTYTINKASPVISQLRIELDSLDLATSINCHLDKLLIDGVSGVFPICGNSSGGHLIIPFSSDPLTLRVVTSERVSSSDRTGSNTMDSDASQVKRRWRMRLTQFANNGPDVAPAGCTQLYSADGTLRSLGQGVGSSGQKYAICFQKKAGMCGVRFDMSAFQPKGILDQLFTHVGAVEPVDGSQPSTDHQQRMDQLPLKPVDPKSEGRPMSKRQIVSAAGLSLQTPLLGIDERLQISGAGLPVLEKVEKVAPPPKPQPYYSQPYGNSIYHQPAQHAQQPKPQVQPWQHAHKPVYGGSYGHQYAPAPQPAVVKEVVLPKPVEMLSPVPTAQSQVVKPVPTVQPQVVQKTLVAETNLLGLVGLNNTATLQVPKGVAEAVFNPLSIPGLALLETPKTIIATNDIQRGTIQGVQIGTNPGVVVARSRRGTDDGSVDGSEGDPTASKTVPCFTSLFIPPTASGAGQLLCLEVGKYAGPSHVSMMGDSLVAFVESSSGSDSGSSSGFDSGSSSVPRSAGWSIPFSFVPC